MMIHLIIVLFYSSFLLRLKNYNYKKVINFFPTRIYRNIYKKKEIVHFSNAIKKLIKFTF